MRFHVLDQCREHGELRATSWAEELSCVVCWRPYICWITLQHGDSTVQYERRTKVSRGKYGGVERLCSECLDNPLQNAPYPGWISVGGRVSVLEACEDEEGAANGKAIEN